MISRTLAVQFNLTSRQMVCGGPPVKSLFLMQHENFGETGLEMSPGFQMLIHWGLMQPAWAPSMGIRLVRLRS